MSYLKLLKEALDTPYKISMKKTSAAHYDGSVKLPDGGYLDLTVFGENDKVHFPERDGLSWKTVFTALPGSPTAVVDEMKAFATVVAGLKQVIKKEDPKFIDIRAEKHRWFKDRGTQYSKMLSKHLGSAYDIRVKNRGRETMFYLTKK